MFLESVCDFLKHLLTKFPKEEYDRDSDFGPLYKEIKTICIEVGWIYKKSRVLLLLAVESFFPSCIDELVKVESFKSFAESFVVVASNYPKLIDDILVTKILELVKKIFYKLGDSGIEGLLDKVLPSIVVKVCHTEIFEKIIEIIDMSTNYLMEKNASFEKICQLFTLLVCENVYFTKNMNANNMKEINVKLIERIIHLRRNNIHSLDRAFSTLGMFSKHLDIHQKFFHCLKDRGHNFSLVFIFEKLLSEKKENLLCNKLLVKECANLISIMVKSGSILHATKDIEVPDMSELFFSVGELCYADEILAGLVCSDLFYELWKLLDQDKQKDQFDKMKKFLEILPSETEVFLLNQNVAFIAAVLKCNLQSSLSYADSKIHNSVDLQLELFRKFIFSQTHTTYSPGEVSYMPLLIDVSFAHFFSLHCLDENVEECIELLEAVSLKEEDKSLQNFCISQFIKNACSLCRWTDSHPFPENKALLKSNIKKNLYPTTLMLEQNPSKSLSIIKDTVSHCLRTLEFLPQTFLSQHHYALLQSLHLLEEMNEAGYLLKKMHPNNASIFFKTLDSTCREWNERPYLMSDEFPFLKELFCARKNSFKSIQKNLSVHFFTEVSNFKDCSDFLMHEVNECVIQLLPIALKHQYLCNVDLKKFSFQELSTEDFHLKNLDMFQFQRKMKSSSKTEEEYIQNLKKELCASILLEEKKEEKDCAQIKKEIFDFILSYSISNHTHWSTKPLEMLTEIFEYCYYEKSEVSYVVKAILSIMEVCRFGDASVHLKLIPKIFMFLKYENESGSIAKALQCCSDIHSSNWIPFLPFLVSNIHHCTQHVKLKPLTNELIKVLLRVAIEYPQHVFFAIEHLRFMEYEDIKGKSNIYEKIEHRLYDINPNLISKFKEFVKIMDDLKPDIYENFVFIFKRLLDKAYCCVFDNLKEGKDIFDLTKIVSSFKEDVVNPTEKEALESLLSHESLACTSETIIDLLKKGICKFTELSAKDLNQERHTRTCNNLQLLSNCLFNLESDVNICLFGQSALMDCSSHVKMYKFLPEVEPVFYNGDFVSKVNFLGHDGKVYSYLMLKDYVSRKETLATMKLMQLLENLNPLLDENVNSSRLFLNFDFPRITPVGPHFTFVPDNLVIAHCDLYRILHAEYFSKDAYFDELFVTSSEEENFLQVFFHSIQTKVPENILINYFINHFPSPLEFFSFKNQFLKHISMLIAISMFLNISTKHLLISTNTGVVSPKHLEFRLDDRAVIDFITPNIKTLIGPLGIKIIVKNIMAVAEFLKNNNELIYPLLHLIKEEYTKEEIERMEIDKNNSLLENLNSITNEKIEDILLSSSKLDFLSRVNPVLYPWF